MFTFEHAWLGVMSFFGVLAAFVLNGFRADIDQANAVATKAKDELAAHKTYAAETFIPRAEVSKKLDDIFETLDEIKDRLPRKGNG